MGRLTLSYGVAQVIAPAMAGSFAEISGSYAGSLATASAVMLMGMGVLWKLMRMDASDVTRLKYSAKIDSVTMPAHSYIRKYSWRHDPSKARK